MTPGDILRGNMFDAMAQGKLRHADLAKRMNDLGYKWVRQTVTDILNARRRVLAEELYGLAVALDMPIPALMASPAETTGPGKRPGGNGYYVADERFPPGTRVTITDFAAGRWHIAYDWPEDVPPAFRDGTNVRIAGISSDGVHGTAFVSASRLSAIDGSPATMDAESSDG